MAEDNPDQPQGLSPDDIDAIMNEASQSSSQTPGAEAAQAAGQPPTDATPTAQPLPTDDVSGQSSPEPAAAPTDVVAGDAATAADSDGDATADTATSAVSPTPESVVDAGSAAQPPDETSQAPEAPQASVDPDLAAAVAATPSDESPAAQRAPTASGPPADWDVSTMGFKQEDIDSALAGAPSGKGSSVAADAAGLSQADIDAALSAAAAEPATSLVNTDGSPKLDSTGKPFDEAAAMMEAAIAEERAAARAGQAAAGAHQPMPPPPADAIPLDLPDFDNLRHTPVDNTVDLLGDVELDVKIELGRAIMLIEDVLRLGEGSVVELDKLAGDPVDVLVNDHLVARGEVLVLNDNFCVRVSEIVAAVDQGEEAAK